MKLRILILLSLFGYIRADNTTLHLSFEDYENYFYRDNTTSVQVVVTKKDAPSKVPARLIIAFPAGNSGIAAFLKPKSAPKVNIALVDDVLSSYTDGKQVGVMGKISLDVDAFIDIPLIGSVRGIRDYVEGGTLHKDMMPMPVLLGPNSISYTYTFHDAITNEILKIASNGPETITITQNKAYLSAGTYKFWGTLNLDVLTPVTETQLLRKDKQNLFTDDKTKEAVQYLSFLAYKQKWLAGGWRFLTYFGRDTLISLRLLMPILSNDAIEAGLGAVFERIKAEKSDNVYPGEIAHEENIGDWANVKHTEKNLDYKMIDTDFELLPLLAAYFLDDPIGQNRSNDLLNRKTSKGVLFSQLLEYNLELVVNVTADFANNPIVSNLIEIKEHEKVGNWRDSEQGLGGGRIPYDVNVALVPSALRAIERLSAAKIIDPRYESIAYGYRLTWEPNVVNLFKFGIDESRAKSSLKSYLANLLLPKSLLENNDNIPTQIHCVSIQHDGTKVPVMNSDFSFNLLYHDRINADYLRYVLKALQLFPKGLLIRDIGMIVANPAYSVAYWNNFTQTSYHGTVVWAFQQTMVIIGLDHQIKLCGSSSPPDWCKDSNLVRQLKDALCMILDVVGENAKFSKYAETWSWTFNSTTNKFSPIGQYDLGGSVESDAVQLWSFGALGIEPGLCGGSPPDDKGHGEMSYNSMLMIYYVLAFFFYSLL